jgi:hypothetical protein
VDGGDQHQIAISHPALPVQTGQSVVGRVYYGWDTANPPIGMVVISWRSGGRAVVYTPPVADCPPCVENFTDHRAARHAATHANRRLGGALPIAECYDSAEWWRSGLLDPLP